MTLTYPPPFQDLRTLAAHICVGESTIKILMARGLLPTPKLINGEKRWEWKEVQKRLLSGRVYFISGGDLIKIGVTKSIARRLKALQAYSPVRLTVICSVKGGLLRETQLHETFSHLRAHGEWFRATPELREYIAALKAHPFEAA